MKITLNVEITEKELAAALLPNGGKITSMAIEEPVKRGRRALTATTQKGAAAKKEEVTKKKVIQKTKAS